MFQCSNYLNFSKIKICIYFEPNKTCQKEDHRQNITEKKIKNTILEERDF